MFALNKKYISLKRKINIMTRRNPVRTLILMAFALIVGLTSCEEPTDTPLKEVEGLFFSGVFDEKTKSITIGNNGYITANNDSTYDDGTLNHFFTSTNFYQSSTGYYISSKEIVSFKYQQIFDNSIAEKDSLFHDMLSKTTIPFLTYENVTDSSTVNGMAISWQDNNGTWWTTTKGPQSGVISIDTTLNSTVVGGVSSREIFISANEFMLYEVEGTDTKKVRDAKARLYFYNTCFY